MKRILAVAALCLLAVGVFAEIRGGPINGGSVKIDTMIWSDAGTFSRVDTMVAGTLNDSTFGVDIGGAKHVAISLIGRSLNDDQDLTYTAQVSNQNTTGGAWHSLNVTYSVDNTAGAQVGGSDNTGRDSTLWLLLNDTVPDSVFTAQTGMTAATHGDMAYVRSNQYLRLIFDPDSSAGDSVLITAVITRIY